MSRLNARSVVKKFAVVLMTASVGWCAAVVVKAQEGEPEKRPVRIRYLSPESVSKGADIVARVIVTDNGKQAIDNTVYTKAVCNVASVWKGNVETEKLVIRQAGGRKGELVTRAGPIPDWENGQEWVLGLNKTGEKRLTVHGLKQGAFRIRGEKAVRNFSGFVFAEEPPAQISKDKTESLTIDELKSRMMPDTGKKDGEAVAVQNQQAKKKKKGISPRQVEKEKSASSEQNMGGRANAAEEKPGNASQKDQTAENLVLGDKWKYFAVFGILFLVNLGLIIRHRYR